MNLKNLAITALLSTSLLFIGCGDDDGTPTPDAAVADMTVGDTSVGDTPVGDAGDDTGAVGMEVPGACASGGSCFFVADQLDVPDGAGGLSEGQNIDSHVTVNGDLEGCGKGDLTHPDGTPGVDNALAALLPFLNSAGDGTISDTIAMNIADGTLLLLLKLDGVDSTEDGEATGTLLFGTVDGGGAPMLNGAGTLEPGQTFTTSMMTIALPGRIEGGKFIATLDALPIPIPAGDNEIILTVNDATLRADLTATGLANGEISGSLSIAELVTAIEESGLDTGGIDLGTILEGQADLNPDMDGICQDMSLALTFNAIDAIEGGVTPAE